jgi:hypothetical protein
MCSAENSYESHGTGGRFLCVKDPSLRAAKDQSMRFFLQPPFLAPPAFSFSLSFLRSPSRTFLTWLRTCTFCAEPLQSSGR